MKKQILLFGAGKSATVLIQTLLEICAGEDWHLLVAELDVSLAESKVGGSAFGKVLKIDVENPEERMTAIATADLVISMLPPRLHFLVGKDCLLASKDLLTASYADAEILSLQDAVRSKNLIFLCEMGLDPGIDHMSAMRLISRIKAAGGKIKSFMSHCGGLVAPESDTNPWHYKISWNPANIVRAGSGGASFRKNGQFTTLPYHEVFAGADFVDFPGYGRWQCYPNRDSTPYISLYQLGEVDNFIRTTLRHPSFIRAWSSIVQAGLTNPDPLAFADSLTYAEWSAPLLPYYTEETTPLFDYLGLREHEPIPFSRVSSAEILQSLLEQKLAMAPKDHDMVLMMHQIEYELNGRRHLAESSFAMRGMNAGFTAMATTVGLPLVHAACLILKSRPGLSGVLLPVHDAIYTPILAALEEDGIVFQETDIILSD